MAREGGAERIFQMEKINQEMEAIIVKINHQGELAKIDPCIPISQQMNFEEYIEQVYRWMIQKKNVTIMEANEWMILYWEDLKMNFKENWGIEASAWLLTSGY